jgi:signal peptidase I
MADNDGTPGPEERTASSGTRPVEASAPVQSTAPELRPPVAPPSEEPTPETALGRDEPQHAKPTSFLRELPVLIAIALVLAILIKTFIVQAFYIPSESMEPTLHGCPTCNGDRILVDKLPYYFHPPRRGDIIVFSNPHPEEGPSRGPIGAFFHWLGEGLGLAGPANEDYIKRVIGLPGETVEIRDHTVYANGQPLDEPYLTAEARASMLDYGPVEVPAGSYFVLGDNRGHSGDSRFGLGFIPADKVVGKAFVIVWPPSHFGLVH